MRFYVGQARGAKKIAELTEAGFGECVQRDEYLPRRAQLGWFLDNGAYKDFKAGKSFDADEYRAAFARLADAPAPDFIVAPDIVAGGRASLDLSLSWVWEIRELAAATWPDAGEVPIYCAIQDGMTAADVHEALDWFDGLFVGGTDDWKYAALPGLVREARLWGDVPVHVGRVGSGRRIVWARICGATSADSCQPLWEKRKTEIAIEALGLDIVDAAAKYKVGLQWAEQAVVGLMARDFLRAYADISDDELEANRASSLDIPSDILNTATQPREGQTNGTGYLSR